MAINTTSKVVTTGKGKSAVESTILTHEINCETCGEKFSISGEKATRGQLWVAAVKNNGWTYKSAAVQFCPMHTGKAERKANSEAKKQEAIAKREAAKAAKAEAKKSEKATVATGKATVTKSGAKVTTGNRVAPKAVEQPTKFSGGASTGKLAKSAKKSSK